MCAVLYSPVTTSFFFFRPAVLLRHRKSFSSSSSFSLSSIIFLGIELHNTTTYIYVRIWYRKADDDNTAGCDLSSARVKKKEKEKMGIGFLPVTLDRTGAQQEERHDNISQQLQPHIDHRVRLLLIFLLIIRAGHISLSKNIKINITREPCVNLPGQILADEAQLGIL